MPSAISPTIKANGAGLTLINVYDVLPENQQDLANQLAEATESFMKLQPGFVSVSIHASTDGAQVVNYAQWTNEQAFRNMLGNPDAQEQMKRFAALAISVKPVVFKVTSTHTA